MAGARLFLPVADSMADTFERLADFRDLSAAGTGQLLANWAVLYLQALAPLIGTLAALGVGVGLLQSRFAVALKPLAPDLNRVNPGAGLTRILSIRTLVEQGKGLLKLSAVGYVAYREVAEIIPQSPNLMGMTAGMAVAELGSRLVSAMQNVGFALLAIGVLDYLYQHWEFRKSLRMTKQELKQDHKQQEGSPELKQRQRQRARELARHRRALKDVPTADVIITNPTHYAVALRYAAETDPAPRVLAKGTDLMAQQIKQMASQYEVPVLENRPLARSLYAAAEVGESVPEELYQAVAEVLAFVYGLRRQRRRSSSHTDSQR